MNSKRVQTIGNIRLRYDGPTELQIGDLHEWVIWQFPSELAGGLCCAVRPPIPNHTWYPAVIGHFDSKIVVHGEISQRFTSPRLVLGWLEKHH